MRLAMSLGGKNMLHECGTGWAKLRKKWKPRKIQDHAELYLEQNRPVLHASQHIALVAYEIGNRI